MKKLILLSILAFAISGCGNLDLIDTNYTYHYAITKWPDGTTKTIKIKQWDDYEGEQIQIIATDGTIYLLSMNNTVLIREANR